MGMFDFVRSKRSEFVCPSGHDMRGEEFQTKDFECVLGYIDIGEQLSVTASWMGLPITPRYTGTFAVYAHCHQCPEVPRSHRLDAFMVETNDGRVVSVTPVARSNAARVSAAAS